MTNRWLLAQAEQQSSRALTSSICEWMLFWIFVVQLSVAIRDASRGRVPIISCMPRSVCWVCGVRFSWAPFFWLGNEATSSPTRSLAEPCPKSTSRACLSCVFSRPPIDIDRTIRICRLNYGDHQRVNPTFWAAEVNPGSPVRTCSRTLDSQSSTEHQREGTLQAVAKSGSEM